MSAPALGEDRCERKSSSGDNGEFPEAGPTSERKPKSSDDSVSPLSASLLAAGVGVLLFREKRPRKRETADGAVVGVVGMACAAFESAIIGLGSVEEALGKTTDGMSFPT